MKDENTLEDRDLYFLGVLAERASNFVVRDGRLPRGCRETQTLQLSRAGYVIGVPHRLADGTEEVRYEITPKGRDAWKACRFS